MARGGIPTYQSQRLPEVSRPLSVPRMGTLDMSRLAPSPLPFRGVQAQADLYADASAAARRGADFVGRAGLQVAEQIQRTTGQITDIGFQLFDGLQTAALRKATAAATMEINEVGSQIMANPDISPLDYEEQYLKAVEEIQAKHGQGLIGAYGESFAASITPAVGRGVTRLRDHAYSITQDQQMAGLGALIDVKGKEYLTVSPKHRPGIMAEVEHAINDSVSKGWLSEVKAQAVLGQFREKVVRLEAEELIGQNPDMWLAISAGDEAPKGMDQAAFEVMRNKYRRNLDPVTFKVLDKEATQAKKAVEEVFQKRLQDNALMLLQERFPGDPESQHSYLRQNWSNMGMSLDMAKPILTELRAEATHQRVLVNEAKQAQEDASYSAASQALRTGDMEKLRVALGGLRPRDRETFYDKIDKEGSKTRPDVIGGTKALIMQGKVRNLQDAIDLGVKPDKYDVVLEAIKKYQAPDEEEKHNHFKDFIDYYTGPGSGRREKKVPLERAMTFVMEQEGIKPTDPRVWEIGKKLKENIPGWMGRGTDELMDVDSFYTAQGTLRGIEVLRRAGVSNAKPLTPVITKYGNDLTNEAIELLRRNGKPVTADNIEWLIEQSKSAAPNYGDRVDGTKKGTGWLGPIELKSGNGVATEKSIGVEIDGKETLIPALVPGLTESEIDAVVNGEDIPRSVVSKAVSHAKKRIKEGKSPFFIDGEDERGAK